MAACAVQRIALALDLSAEKSQRRRHEPFQRAAVACVEEGGRACVGTSRFAPVFVPGKQLGEHVRAVHHVARVVQEFGEALLGRAQPVPSDPFEGLELSGGAIARGGAAGGPGCPAA